MFSFSHNARKLIDSGSTSFYYYKYICFFMSAKLVLKRLDSSWEPIVRDMIYIVTVDRYEIASLMIQRCQEYLGGSLRRQK